MGDGGEIFYDLAQLGQTGQIIAALSVFEFLLSSFFCVIRLKPMRLMRFWVHTIDFALIGYLYGNLMLILSDILGENFLGNLILLPLYIIPVYGLPWILCLVAIVPIYSWLMLPISIITRLFKGFDVEFEGKDGSRYSVNLLLVMTDMLLP